MKAIYKRELRSYFTGMTGYIFIAFLLLLIGVYSTIFNFVAGYPRFEYAISQISFVYLILVPILTMRALSEERHQKTDQLLLSSPVPVSGILCGKYLAMLTVLAIPLAVSALYPLILTLYGPVYLRVTYSVLLGFFLLGAALIAVGLFMSSLTENQLIAAALAFAAAMIANLSSGLSTLITNSTRMSLLVFTGLVVILLFIVRAMTKDWFMAVSVAAVCEIAVLALRFINSALIEGAVRPILDALAMFDRMQGFMSGEFDVTAILYYFSVIALFLFFSMQSVEKRRWS